MTNKSSVGILEDVHEYLYYNLPCVTFEQIINVIEPSSLVHIIDRGTRRAVPVKLYGIDVNLPIAVLEQGRNAVLREFQPHLDEMAGTLMKEGSRLVSFNFIRNEYDVTVDKVNMLLVAKVKYDPMYRELNHKILLRYGVLS